MKKPEIHMDFELISDHEHGRHCCVNVFHDEVFLGEFDDMAYEEASASAVEILLDNMAEENLITVVKSGTR